MAVLQDGPALWPKKGQVQFLTTALLRGADMFHPGHMAGRRLNLLETDNLFHLRVHRGYQLTALAGRMPAAEPLEHITELAIMAVGRGVSRPLEVMDLHGHREGRIVRLLAAPDHLVIAER